MMVGLDFPGSHSTVEPTVSIAVGGRTGIVTRVIRRANRVAAGGSTLGPLLHSSHLSPAQLTNSVFSASMFVWWDLTHNTSSCNYRSFESINYFYQFTLWASTSVCHVEFGSSEGVPGQVANEGGCHGRGRGYPAGAILRISTSICYNTNTKT